jgi:Pectate lyase superfamily protein/Major tropism determinant N-terminal domain
MAVIEIAKIQVRRGQENQTGKPLTLDSGEFGWAVDSQKLYIGNGTIAEGAPTTGITEIYTEHSVSNIFNLAGTYVYQGNTTASPVITGPETAGNTQLRSIQKKLDDIVNIADFGITPHDTNTLTLEGAPVYKQIQQAIDQIFLNDDKSNAQSRRKLFFPAGNYIITGTIYVPPYANLIGDGPDKTILTMSTSSRTLMQFVDGTSIKQGPYITTSSITSAGRPKDIYIEGLTFSYASPSVIGRTNVYPLLMIDAARDCQIVRCKFKGYHDTSLSSGIQYAGIDIHSQGAIVSKNILIKDSQFDSIRTGIKSDYNIEDISIDNNKFYNLYRGISYSESAVLNNDIGPIRTTIRENVFENIEYEGIYVGTNVSQVPTNHISSFNSFKEVGNNITGDGTGTNYIISYNTPGNVSIGDKVARETYLAVYGLDNMNYPPTVHGKTYIESGKTYSTSITGYAESVLTRLPYSNSDQKIKLQYVLNKHDQGFSRKGDLTVSVSNLVLGTTATVTDNFTFVDTSGTYGDGGISFTADVNTLTNQVRVLYYSEDPYGTLDYQYSYLQQ